MQHEFSTISRRSVVDTIVEEIKRSLLKGTLTPGQKLPSEQELSSQFGVGRGSIREAMKMLTAIGVLDIRQGDGTYVTESIPTTVLDPLIFSLISSNGTSEQLLELRKTLEIGCAELAAEKADNAAFERMEAAIDALEEYAASGEGDPATLAELDIAFHRAIFNAAENPLLVKVAETVIVLFESSISRSIAGPGGIDRAIQHHRQTLVALRERDPEKLRAAVHTALRGWEDHMDGG